MKLVVAALATATAALAGPSVAEAAMIRADPDQPCYREQEELLLPGEGFTPNTQVDFSRDGMPLKLRDDRPIVSDPAGAIGPILTLPERLKGQRRYKYLATDTADPTNTATLDLLVTATRVDIGPAQGRPERPFRIRARGFFGGGKRLWAHIVRRGSGRARNIKVGRIKGACKKVKAKRRLFERGAASGTYRVQFDTFKRYHKKRAIQSVYTLRISRRSVPAAAQGASAWNGHS
jgi:hypothetical protein